MANSSVIIHMSPELTNLLRSTKGDALSFRQIFDAIAGVVPCAQVLMTSTLPRGGTQVIQPPFAPEVLLKGYNRELFLEDRLTWAAILQDRPVRGVNVWPDSTYEVSRYVQELLEPAELRFSAAAPLKAPLFRGYPGALHLYRKLGDPAFSDEDLARLKELAHQLDESIIQHHQARETSKETYPAWSHHDAARQFVFDASGKQLLPQWGNPIDQRLIQQMQQHAQHRLARLESAKAPLTDRLQLPDSRGDLWVLRATTYSRYPALSDGAVVYFTVQPESWEWNGIRAADVQADPEMSRLMPAVKFMHDEFGRSPTLNEIAAKAHLSPFHFHRRFTELLGQTPKHYLLSCQVYRSKQLLADRQVELTDIARQCGFAHQSHFTSRFKQATGLTPTRWRRLAEDLMRR